MDNWLFAVDDDIDLSGLLSDDDSSFLPKETLEPTSKKFSIAAKSSTTEPSSIPKSSPSIKQATPVINAKEATSNHFFNFFFISAQTLSHLHVFLRITVLEVFFCFLLIINTVTLTQEILVNIFSLSCVFYLLYFKL